jgi:hypothetical protein
MVSRYTVFMTPDVRDVIARKYRLDAELLVSGSGCRVFRATGLVLCGAVVVKLPSTELSGDEGFRNRFLPEARTAVSLPRHRHLVTVHDFGVDNPADGTITTVAGNAAPYPRDGKPAGDAPLNSPALACFDERTRSVRRQHRPGRSPLHRRRRQLPGPRRRQCGRIRTLTGVNDLDDYDH